MILFRSVNLRHDLAIYGVEQTAHAYISRVGVFRSEICAREIRTAEILYGHFADAITDLGEFGEVVLVGHEETIGWEIGSVKDFVILFRSV